VRDETEFTEFATASAPRLYRSALLLCGDPHLAEDLVQETLARIYVRMHTLGRFEGGRFEGGRIENPAGYAQTALVRIFISSRRRRSSGEIAVDAVPEMHSLAADDALRLTLGAALAELAPLDRAVIVLRHLDDRSVAEVAAALGLSEGAVRNRSMRALDRLRERLGATLPELLLS
jgi:RNA polymerase sigma-70 factor (sigma-E family)